MHFVDKTYLSVAVLLMQNCISLFAGHTALEALCDYALYKSTFTLHYIYIIAFVFYVIMLHCTSTSHALHSTVPALVLLDVFKLCVHPSMIQLSG